MKNQIALEATNLSFKRDANAPYFFKDENLRINYGEIVFIKGENGAGKSTLFNLIAGKTKSGGIISGEIKIDEKENNFCRVASLPQAYQEALACNFTFNENLGLSKLPNMPTLKIFKPDKSNLLTLNIGSINRNIPIRSLSGGQKQILAIKTFLLKEPAILLLDEPTATLDENNANLVFSFLKNLVQKNKIAIIIICHQNNLIDKYGDACFEVRRNKDISDPISYVDKLSM